MYSTNFKTHGFSLLELMVVTAIMGILAFITVPKFTTYIASAKRSEAKSNLYHIVTLIDSYSYDNGDSFDGAAVASATYPTNIGWEPGANDYYLYSLTQDPIPNGDTTFTVQAVLDPKKLFCTSGGQDTWTIDENFNIPKAPTVDGLAGC
jgi:prepilin-type N-terminal cleavage/methylation domain-containing protein